MEKKFRTKNQRHIYDDEKRRESLQKKLRQQQSQKELIKKALSDNTASKAKKIVFDDVIVKGTENVIEENAQCNGFSYACQKGSEDKPHLFEESDNDGDENYEIQIKSQFEGKKGHKLLSLQSTYNNDERFRLDERFKDDSDSDDDDDREVTSEHSRKKVDESEDVTEQNDFAEEKTKQLKVLETVLGRPIQMKSETEKRSKKSYFDMVRYDASNEDHKRKQKDVGSQAKEKTDKKKKKKKMDGEERKKRKEGETDGNRNVSKVSQAAEKKFYEVSDELKAALENRKTENGQFSLLAAFSKKSENDEEESDEDEKGDIAMRNEGDDMETEDNVINGVWRASEEEKNIYDSMQTSNEVSKEMGKVQGIVREKFFFTDDDPRIEEGLTFINMKNSEEAGKAVENYDETRRDIREVLRLRWQKHRQRNNPFKKKIGGSNKQNTLFNNNRKQFGKGNFRRKR